MDAERRKKEEEYEEINVRTWLARWYAINLFFSWLVFLPFIFSVWEWGGELDKLLVNSRKGTLTTLSFEKDECHREAASLRLKDPNPNPWNSEDNNIIYHK